MTCYMDEPVWTSEKVRELTDGDLRDYTDCEIVSYLKKYKAKNGLEVRLYAGEGAGRYCVHGAIKNGDGWHIRKWTKYGKASTKDHENDLVEVKPRIKRTVWINIDRQTDDFWHTKKSADENASKHRVACVRVEIDCEEGEGL